MFWCSLADFITLDIVKYIIEQISSLQEKKKLINVQNEEGNTPLHWAALNGHYEVVEALVNAGADCTVSIIFYLKEHIANIS